MPLKSAEEWLTDPSNKARKTEQDVVEWITQIQHNALLHAAEINRKIAGTYSPIGIVRQQLMAAAEEIESAAQQLKTK